MCIPFTANLPHISFIYTRGKELIQFKLCLSQENTGEDDWKGKEVSISISLKFLIKPYSNGK